MCIGVYRVETATLVFFFFFFFFSLSVCSPSMVSGPNEPSTRGRGAAQIPDLLDLPVTDTDQGRTLQLPWKKTVLLQLLMLLLFLLLYHLSLPSSSLVYSCRSNSPTSLVIVYMYNM